MKFLASFVVASLVMGGSAFAQASNTSGSQSGATSSVVVNSPADVRSTVRSVPSAIAPGLTASAVETCLGSASVGGSGMGWGAAFGLTVKDHSCDARLDAKMLATLGQGKAAVLRLCTEPKMAKALQAQGVDCNTYNRTSYATIAAATNSAAPARTVNTRNAQRPVREKKVVVAGTRVFNHMDQRWETR